MRDERREGRHVGSIHSTGDRSVLHRDRDRAHIARDRRHLSLSGVVEAPITPFGIVAEMTENHALVIPIGVGALRADVASKPIVPHGGRAR